MIVADNLLSNERNQFQMCVDSDPRSDESTYRYTIKSNHISKQNFKEIDTICDQIKKNERMNSSFIIDKEIGKGASAKILLCMNRKNIKQKYAAKIISRSSKLFKKFDTKKFKEIVMNEVLIQMNCRHNNIITGMGFFPLGDDTVAFIQELASNGNLSDFLNNLRSKVNTSINMKKKGKIYSESVLCYVAYNLVSALKHLNAVDVFHQDIKPENVVVNEKFEIKFTDFSVSVKLDSYRQYYQYLKNGTFGYMAPENISCKVVPIRETFKSDYYSLGVLLYKLKFGYLPYDIDQMDSIDEQLDKITYNPIEFDESEEISKEFKDFLKGLLQYNYDKRFNIEKIVNHPWLKKCKSVYALKENYGSLEKFFLDLYNDNICT